MEVLDTVCFTVTFSIPDEARTDMVDKLIRRSCEAFVQEYEDELIHVYYNNAEPGKDRMCKDTISGTFHACVCVCVCVGSKTDDEGRSLTEKRRCSVHPRRSCRAASR